MKHSAGVGSLKKNEKSIQDVLYTESFFFFSLPKCLSMQTVCLYSLLYQSLSQAYVDLPSVVIFEPYNPRINLEGKEVIAYHSSAVALKEWITKLMEQPLENRISVLKPGV